MKFPKEVEYGNIEYKLKITTNENIRLEQLASQMKWRLNEGNNEAIYYVGVDDEGYIEGITDEDYNKSIKNISKITKMINSKIKKIDKKSYDGKFYYIIEIISYQEKKFTKNVIFIGPQFSGKSTIIGNLINNIKDDGKGKSKQFVLNHKHEIFTGITSSVSIKNFNIENYDANINLIDTPGKVKYRKTTISAISKYNPNLIFLVIDGENMEDIEFYLKLINFLDIEHYIILTKKDKNVNLDNLKLKFDSNKILEISNITRYGYSKMINKIKESEIKNDNRNYLIQICDILSVPNMNKIYTGLTFNEINLNDDFFLHTSNKVKKIKFDSIFYLDKPIKKINKNCLITFTLNEDTNVINKTDLVITNNKILKSYKYIFVNCDDEISYNQGICIFNNQYLFVKIEKTNNILKLISLNSKFRNVSDKIFLKVNEKFHFCKLVI